MALKERTFMKHKLLAREVLPRISGRRDARNGRRKMAAGLLTLGVMLAWTTGARAQTLVIERQLTKKPAHSFDQSLSVARDRWS